MSHTIPTNFDAYGLFIKPCETASSYEARARPMLENRQTEPSFNHARSIVQKLFNADPVWVEVTYSNKDLYPWEIACTWYDTVPSIQLHTRFKRKKTVFWIYSEDDVLVHEYVHAIRAPLGDSIFEEFFSYHISNAFRRYVGPIFETPAESLLFVSLFSATICAAFVTDIFWIPFGALFLYFALRLIKRLYQFRRCLRHLSSITTSPLALMIRLTDEEIIQYSKESPAEILRGIQEKKAGDFRWHMLYDSYCKNCPAGAE